MSRVPGCVAPVPVPGHVPGAPAPSSVRGQRPRLRSAVLGMREGCEGTGHRQM